MATMSFNVEGVEILLLIILRWFPSIFIFLSWCFKLKWGNGENGDLFWAEVLPLRWNMYMYVVLQAQSQRKKQRLFSLRKETFCFWRSEIKYWPTTVLFKNMTLTVGLLRYSLHLLRTLVGRFNVHRQKFYFLVRPVKILYNFYIIVSKCVLIDPPYV